MKNQLLICSLIMSLLTGCETTFSLANPAIFDYHIDGVYRLNQPMFLFSENKNDPTLPLTLTELGYSGTAKDLSTFKQQMPKRNQVVKLLPAGSCIVVTTITQYHNLESGKIININARESQQTREFSLNMISRGWPAVAMVDTNLLELVK